MERAKAQDGTRDGEGPGHSVWVTLFDIPREATTTCLERAHQIPARRAPTAIAEPPPWRPKRGPASSRSPQAVPGPAAQTSPCCTCTQHVARKHQARVAHQTAAAPHWTCGPRGAHSNDSRGTLRINGVIDAVIHQDGLEIEREEYGTRRLRRRTASGAVAHARVFHFDRALTGRPQGQVQVCHEHP